MTHDMKDIHQCVLCARTLRPNREHADTCGERCYKKLLEMQRDAYLADYRKARRENETEV